MRPARTGESRAQQAAHANLHLPANAVNPRPLNLHIRPSQTSAATIGTATKIVKKNLPIYLPHRSLFNFEGLQTVACLFRLTFHNIAVLVEAEFNFKDPV